MDPDRLQVFAAVVRERGFSAAARKLGRSQPAVSQAIAALEEELGQRLFVREARAAVPTHAGEALLVHAERILDEIARAKEHVAALGSLREGRLSLGTTDTLACHLLPPVLAQFRKRYPGVELRIDTRPSPVIAERVAAHELDLGVVTVPLGRRVERVRLEPIGPQRDVAIVPNDDRLATRKRIRLSELAARPLILLDRTTSTRAWVEAELAREDLVPNVVMDSSSVEVLIRLVELGFGASIVPEMAAARARVTRLDLVGVPERQIAMVTPEGSVTRVAEVFAEMVRQRGTP